MNKKELIEDILSRSIAEIYPSKEALRQRLESGRKLRVYVGIDPTASHVHLGHATNYLLLERFHRLGHKLIVLVGDFTATIGDPSDKSAVRSQLTPDQVKQNLKTYKQQIGKILPFNDKKNPVEFRFNADWLAGLSLADMVELASNFTIQQMIERDVFQRRLADQKPLYVHEFFYPLMQGYDSVALQADVEVGGTDQTFNMLAGRTLVKRLQNRDKFVITTTLLENPATGEKLMSKSQGTGVSLAAPPNEMYAQVMALPDAGIIQTFVDCTRLSMGDIERMKLSLAEGENPRNVKMNLAREIVSTFCSRDEALEAEAAFVSQFRDKELPEDIPLVQTKLGQRQIDELLVELSLATSRSAAKRRLEQGGVRINGERIETEVATMVSGDVVQAGKRRFLRLK